MFQLLRSSVFAALLENVLLGFSKEGGARQGSPRTHSDPAQGTFWGGIGTIISVPRYTANGCREGTVNARRERAVNVP